jgi:multidrug efflux system outer membrane protein
MPNRLRECFRRRLNLRGHMLALATTCLLAACAVGPDYRKPELTLPDAWQAALPHGGQVNNLIDWWSQFKDPTLVQLLQSAEADSPSLGQAAAAIEEARAVITSSRSAALPSLTGAASATRAGDQQGVSGVESVTSVALDAAWELDIFGGVRRATEAARARLAARQRDWHEARVSLAAEVATDYTNYRACQLLVAANTRALQSQQELRR